MTTYDAITFDWQTIELMIASGLSSWWICSVVSWWTLGKSFKDALRGL